MKVDKLTKSKFLTLKKIFRGEREHRIQKFSSTVFQNKNPGCPFQARKYIFDSLGASYLENQVLDLEGMLQVRL